ncbi:hypothetical protein D3C76_1678800 [compost metagenome]
MYSTTPGTCASCGRSRSISSLAETSRSPRGLRAIQKRPLAMVWLLPVTPTEWEKALTAGSASMIFASARCLSIIDGYDTSAAASVVPRMKPVSCRGKKPLGMAT